MPTLKFFLSTLMIGARWPRNRPYPEKSTGTETRTVSSPTVETVIVPAFAVNWYCVPTHTFLPTTTHASPPLPPAEKVFGILSLTSPVRSATAIDTCAPMVDSSVANVGVKDSCGGFSERFWDTHAASVVISRNASGVAKLRYQMRTSFLKSLTPPPCRRPRGSTRSPRRLGFRAPCQKRPEETTEILNSEGQCERSWN